MVLKHHVHNFAIQHKYLALTFILCVVWALSALGVYLFELGMGDEASSYRSWGAALKAIAICLTSGFDIDPPTTTGALVVAIFALICGVITVGGLIACLTSDLVSRVFFGLKIPAKSPRFTLEGHFVVIGWSDKADRIVRELHAEVLPVQRPIVIITEHEERPSLPDPERYRSVWTVHGSATDEETLCRADVATAETAIILADDGEDDPDAKSLLVCLAIEAINPRVYTCVELNDARNRRHLARVNADELISVHDISENLLAQCAMSKDIASVMYELLTFQTDGNELYIVSLPSRWLALGYTFGEMAAILHQHHIIAVGVQEELREEQGGHFTDREGAVGARRRGKIAINPPHDSPLEEGSKLLLLALAEPDLELLSRD